MPRRAKSGILQHRRANALPDPSNKSATAWLGRAIFLIAAIVLVGRGALISRAHSECWDDQYHIIRGERFLWLDKRGILMNDPPLGEAIVALPVTVTRVLFGTWDDASRQVIADAGLRDHPLSPDAILMLIAIWKSLLFVPCVWIAYLWARELYGRVSGCLAAGMVLIDPTFAAHAPIAALDTLGATAIVLACYLAMKYAQAPNPRRLAGLCAATAAAMLIKHTALILPAVALLIILVMPRPAQEAQPTNGSLRSRLQPLAAGALLLAGFIWAMTLFDVSEPRDFGRVFDAEYTQDFSFRGDLLNGAMMNRWPAGIYLGSIAEAINHGQDGHPAVLLGQTSSHGWWYYFPVVAAYKVPIGFAAALALSVFSLIWRRWRRAEWALLIPLLAWTAFLMSAPINIGFRHFLPAYAFMLIFASRAAATDGPRWSSAICALAVVAGAAHALAWHPNYLSYVNFPRQRVYLQIADSNLEWGQALKQVRQWLDEHPQSGDVWLGYYGERTGQAIRYYLGDRVKRLDGKRPASGTLIISPTWLAGGDDIGERYAYLRQRKPEAIIGDCMLVFRLDENP